ncbi:MAG: methylmalonyl Co-A mutase-associated GTPase MeaB [Chloroflexi bacterium]|nr:methylmalonyl Co-A mutase-associated GTPase MeaB [Chloroflexota bacterium]
MEDLVTRLLDGNLNAVPRILTLLEKGDPQADDIMQRIAANTTGAHRIGITGPPGAGKSTLVEAMTAELRKQDLTVGVLVVDPSSPFTGGAILGDRVRMRDHFLDPGVFIRSMATRGASGGLSAIAPSAMRVLDAAGVDVIIVETAGVGQTELDIMHTVDSVVVVVVPEAGDAIQTMKAGLLEIADVFVVNKADRPGAKRMANDLETTVHLGSRDMDWWTIPVLQTEGIRNKGVTELVEAVGRHHETLRDAGRLEARRAEQRRSEFHAALRERLLDRLTRAEHSDALAEILHQVETGQLPPITAATHVLQNPNLLK